MKTKTYPVSSTIDGKRQVIGEATYFEFETLAEAVEQFGEAGVLALVNSQHKTNEMNKVRAEFTAGPSRESLENEAMVILTTTRLADLQAAAGDAQKIGALREEVIEELKKKHEERRRERALAAQRNARESEQSDGE